MKEMQFILIILVLCLTISCTKKEVANIQLELETIDGQKVEEINSIFFTNKPELLTGSSPILFWRKWGLNTFEFNNLNISGDKFYLENLSPGEYSIFIDINKNGKILEGRSHEVKIKAGNNKLKSIVYFSHPRSYYTDQNFK